MELKTWAWTWTLLFLFFFFFQILLGMSFNFLRLQFKEFLISSALWSRHWAKYFTWIMLFNSSNKPMWGRPLLSPFYKWITGAWMVKQNSSFSSNTKSLEVITPVAVNWKKTWWFWQIVEDYVEAVLLRNFWEPTVLGSPSYFFGFYFQEPHQAI